MTDQKETELIPHLFRTEYRKIVAVLTSSFGLEHLQTAEDIVSDTFLLAAETWGLKGLPQNPVAWLYTVSKNKSIDFLRRQKRFSEKVGPGWKQSATEEEIDLSGKNMEDSQLRMIFAVCYPGISAEAQVGLALNILCGFGVEEIADAFLTNKETIYKRLSRAKEKLRTEKISLELPADTQIKERMQSVLTTLYLLFSEGYYSTSQNATLRKELCLEAMRLNIMLTENEATDIPAANALLALMCFHASRFEARIGQNGNLVLYEDQDETLWNKELIVKGEYYLNRGSKGKELTKYHLEAAIAYWHTHKKDSAEKWENILQLYNRLLQIEYSPVTALNRTFALSKANGVEEAITEAKKLNLTENHLYYSLLANLHADLDPQQAKEYLHTAQGLVKTNAEREVIERHLRKLERR